MHAYIVDAIRSPRGQARETGALAGVKPVALLAQMLNALRTRNGFGTEAVADMVIGCVTQTGDQGANIGKTAALYAGWSPEVSAVTLNRYCASGLSAVNFAAAQATAQDGLTVAGGVEAMSRVPMFADKGALYDDPEITQRTNFVHMGLGADLVATQHGFSREECDEYAYISHSRARAAQAGGRYTSLVPVTDEAGNVLLATDQTVRPDVTREKLAAREPAFVDAGEKGGNARLAQLFPGLPPMRHVHHAGNSPQMADGAAAVLLASASALRRAGLHPRARILAVADASTAITQTGAVQATRKALGLAGLTIADIDLFEVRDSFAAVTLHYIRTLGIPLDRFNVNGSSIALGHPMGATGAMLVGTLLDEMDRRGLRLGLVAIAGAAGVATATIIERLSDAQGE